MVAHTEETGMSQRPDALCGSHDARLRAIERSVNIFSAHIQSEEYRLKEISGQIERLGGTVSQSIQRLSDSVETLSERTQSHHNFLTKVADDRRVSVERKRRVKKLGWGALVAIIAAVASQVGSAAWEWIKRVI
jgi:methyl-accepting chemotaxis protein